MATKAAKECNDADLARCRAELFCRRNFPCRDRNQKQKSAREPLDIRKGLATAFTQSPAVTPKRQPSVDQKNLNIGWHNGHDDHRDEPSLAPEDRYSHGSRMRMHRLHRMPQNASSVDLTRPYSFRPNQRPHGDS